MPDGDTGVREAMKKYFDLLLGEWRAKHGSLPMIADADSRDPRIFVGEANSEGWIQWRPVERDRPEDWSHLESQLGIVLHSSVKEYFDSYWFCTIGGTFRGRRVQLDGNLPDGAATELPGRLRGYKRAHQEQLTHVPIGFETTQSLLLVVDNRTGEVLAEDYERGTFESLARGLTELIAGLHLGPAPSA